MSHTCNALVATCIDFRFQEFIDSWIRQNFRTKNHDRVAWAGGVKDWENVLNQIRISKRLHEINKVVLINHEDCGAYGEAGTAEKHKQDLKKAAEAVQTEIPGVEVETYYLHLDGTFEKV